MKEDSPYSVVWGSGLEYGCWHLQPANNMVGMPYIYFILPFGRLCIIISCICGIWKNSGNGLSRLPQRTGVPLVVSPVLCEEPWFPSLVLYTDEVLLLWESIIIALCLVMKWPWQLGLIFGVYQNHIQALEVCEFHLNTACLIPAILNSLYTSTCY